MKFRSILGFVLFSPFPPLSGPATAQKNAPPQRVGVFDAQGAMYGVLLRAAIFNTIFR